MAAIADSGERIVSAVVPDQVLGLAGSFDETWDILGTLSFINEHSFRKVALQFPDTLLSYASKVCQKLQSQVGPNVSVFVVADSSYSSCCVDFVTCQHWAADSVVHYGPACLSRTTSVLPIHYVFLRSSLDISALVDAVRNSELSGTDRNVVVVFDLCFAHLREQLSESLGSVVSRFKLRQFVRSVLPPGTTEEYNSVCGTAVDPEDVILWIGAECLELTNILMCCSKNQVWKFDTNSITLDLQGATTNRMLMKRFNLIQRAIDANVIGILISTLAVDGFVQVAQALRDKIHQSGRRAYTVVVGKLNEAKLANFSDIEIFVVVACRLNTVVDCKNFLQPLITPFELNIVLAEARNWTGEYSTEFSRFLSERNPFQDQQGDQTQQTDNGGDNNTKFYDDEDREVRTSLVTGTVVRRPKIQYETQSDSVSSEMIAVSGHTAIISHAAQALQRRTFQGIDPRIGLDSVQDVVEGRAGIASHFEGEPHA
eukprot:c8198_g1_i1.p1 GENE.c8198_g1_i1~~c8198_g1_i1.p1  ORF type:complete len:498 (+),score=109.91 c8198_g1_i1:41-1495(+)